MDKSKFLGLVKGQLVNVESQPEEFSKYNKYMNAQSIIAQAKRNGVDGLTVTEPDESTMSHYDCNYNKMPDPRYVAWALKYSGKYEKDMLENVGIIEIIE